MQKTIYFETARGALVPVAIISSELDENGTLQVTVKAKRTAYGYKAGEIFTRPRYRIVNKTRRINGRQYVRAAIINNQEL